MKKIDVFAHILTPGYSKKLASLAPEVLETVEYTRPAVVDIDIRERLMSRYPDVLQIITMGNVPPEKFVAAKDAIELAKIGNEEMAELAITRPHMFFGAVGTIPVDDIDASLKEIEHCICDLGLFGIQLFTTLERDSFAEPKYRPIFALMAELDRPIWVHPAATNTPPERCVFTWPYESSRFMLDMVVSGIFSEFPDLKIIIHHAGGMVPYFQERVRTATPKHIERFFKYFYTDTAIYGYTPGLMCAYDYFGAEHIMFGTDMPLSGPPPVGYGSTDRTIRSIEEMDIPDADKKKIFQDNAIKMFGTLV